MSSVCDRKSCTSLKDGLFTSAAIDNIDSNPSPPTANLDFHGTSISIFQNPKEDYPDEPLILDINSDFEHENATLTSIYTNIEPTKDGKPRPLQYMLLQCLLETVK